MEGNEMKKLALILCVALLLGSSSTDLRSMGTVYGAANGLVGVVVAHDKRDSYALVYCAEDRKRLEATSKSAMITRSKMVDLIQLLNRSLNEMARRGR